MSGGGAGTGDLFNAGAATVKGIELLATYDVIDNREKRFKLPVTLSYTFTDTKLKNNFNSSIWGTVESGDEITSPKKIIGNHRSFRNYKIQLFR
jgi:Fe(3+) dicitrate transport protein